LYRALATHHVPSTSYSPLTAANSDAATERFQNVAAGKRVGAGWVVGGTAVVVVVIAVVVGDAAVTAVGPVGDVVAVAVGSVGVTVVGATAADGSVVAPSPLQAASVRVRVRVRAPDAQRCRRRR